MMAKNFGKNPPKWKVEPLISRYCLAIGKDEKHVHRTGSAADKRNGRNGPHEG